MLSVNNNLRYTECPLSREKNIHPVGTIVYSQPIQFSTNEIQINFVPELWKCSGCMSYFTQYLIPEDLAITLYSQGVSSERWSGDTFQNQKPTDQINCLKRYFSDGKKVLDVGCNTGELLDFAKSLGCETFGVEYSRNSRDILKAKGHKAYPSINDAGAGFDVITAFDLVEHLYDLPSFFLECKRMLNVNGVLIVLTGNSGSISSKLSKSNWWYLKYPEHIVFPSRKYFLDYSGFFVTEWIKTYASIGYINDISVSLVKRVVTDFVAGIYNGLPSLGADHVMVVLKNEK